MRAMSWSSLLPRLLLAICLILNGIGSSTASLRMQLDHGVLDTVAGLPMTETAPMQASSGEPGVATSDHCADQSRADCCDPGECDGACLQGAAAMAVREAVATLPGIANRLKDRPAPAHADPALTDPVRPPIA